MKTRAKQPAPESPGAADPAPAGETIESLAARLDATDRPPPDAAGAVTELAIDPDAGEEPGEEPGADAAGEPPADAPATGKRGPGRPKGSRNRPKDGTARRRQGGRKETKAEAIARADALQARLDAMTTDAGEGEPVDPVERAAQVIEGAIVTGSELVKGGRFRAFTFSQEEAAGLGRAWGPVAAPHMATLAEHAPVALAIFATAQVLYPKYLRFTEDEKVRAAIDAGEDVPTATAPAEPFPRPRGAEGGDGEL